MKKTLIFALVFNLFLLSAQNRTEFWAKLQTNVKINEKWTIGTDVQYRTQANYYQNHQLFDYGLTRGVRLWAFYRLPHSFVFTAAPIAYFHNTEILGDGRLTHNHELRTMWGIQKQLDRGQWKQNVRLLAEVRRVQFNLPTAFMQYRYRLKYELTHPICRFNESLTLAGGFYDEFFIRTQAGVTGFDQNRSYAFLQVRSPQTLLNIGYQHTFSQSKATVFQRYIALVSFQVNL